MAESKAPVVVASLDPAISGSARFNSDSSEDDIFWGPRNVITEEELRVRRKKEKQQQEIDPSYFDSCLATLSTDSPVAVVRPFGRDDNDVFDSPVQLTSRDRTNISVGASSAVSGPMPVLDLQQNSEQNATQTVPGPTPTPQTVSSTLSVAPSVSTPPSAPSLAAPPVVLPGSPSLSPPPVLSQRRLSSLPPVLPSRRRSSSLATVEEEDGAKKNEQEELQLTIDAFATDQSDRTHNGPTPAKQARRSTIFELSRENEKMELQLKLQEKKLKMLQLQSQIQKEEANLVLASTNPGPVVCAPTILDKAQSNPAPAPSNPAPAPSNPAPALPTLSESTPKTPLLASTRLDGLDDTYNMNEDKENEVFGVSNNPDRPASYSSNSSSSPNSLIDTPPYKLASGLAMGSVRREAVMGVGLGVLTKPSPAKSPSLRQPPVDKRPVAGPKTPGRGVVFKEKIVSSPANSSPSQAATMTPGRSNLKQNVASPQVRPKSPHPMSRPLTPGRTGASTPGRSTPVSTGHLPVSRLFSSTAGSPANGSRKFGTGTPGVPSSTLKSPSARSGIPSPAARAGIASPAARSGIPSPAIRKTPSSLGHSPHLATKSPKTLGSGSRTTNSAYKNASGARTPLASAKRLF